MFVSKICPLFTNHIAVTCSIIDNGDSDPNSGSGNCQFSNSAALKSAVDAYTSAGTTYTDNGTTKVLTTLGDIGTWCTSGITSMSNLFNGKSSFNESINAWDTSSVTKMNHIVLEQIQIFDVVPEHIIEMNHIVPDKH